MPLNSLILARRAYLESLYSVAFQKRLENIECNNSHD